MSLKGLFSEYQAYHRTTGNKLTHIVGVPLIMYAVIGYLHLVPLRLHFAPNVYPADLGLAIGILVSGWVLAEGAILLGLAFLGEAVLFWIIAIQTTWVEYTLCFVIGWVIQLAGHLIWEKRRPALMDNLIQIFVGPVYILAWMIPFIAPKWFKETS